MVLLYVRSGQEAWVYAVFRRPPVLFAALPRISVFCLVRGRLKNCFTFQTAFHH
ncbi:hypothetical protein [Neisseria elongata]|uniref:hypothetical protein n=1 Tax=Neisseria elongata TaxID=495 RepID=UPI0028D0AF31|nr:hypothetical protein [Neisseria elongata]